MIYIKIKTTNDKAGISIDITKNNFNFIDTFLPICQKIKTIEEKIDISISNNKCKIISSFHPLFEVKILNRYIFKIIKKIKKYDIINKDNVIKLADSIKESLISISLFHISNKVKQLVHHIDYKNQIPYIRIMQLSRAETAFIQIEYERLKKENDDLYKRNIELYDEKENFKKENDDLNKENERIKKENDDLNKINDDLYNENERLKKDRDDLGVYKLDNFNDDLYNENERVKYDNDYLHKINDDLHNENERIKYDNEDLHRENYRIKKEIYELNRKYDNLCIKTVISESNKENKILQAYTVDKNNYDNLCKENAELKVKLERQQNEYNFYRVSSNYLSNENKKLNIHIQEHENKYNLKLKEVEMLQKEVIFLKKEITNNIQINNELNYYKEYNENKYNLKVKEFDMLQKEVMILKKEITILTKNKIKEIDIFK